MRIVTRITAGLGRSLTRIPFPRTDLANCLDATGHIDRVKAQLAFADDPNEPTHTFRPAKTDDETVYFCAFTFLDLFHSAYMNVIENTDADLHEGITCKQDERLEARMSEAKCVFANTDIRRTADGAKVRILTDNPFSIVGPAECEAREFAVTCAQIWLRIIDQVKWLTIDAPADILEDARAHNREAEARQMRENCPHRVNGYCSPPQTKCPCYKNGRCVECK